MKHTTANLLFLNRTTLEKNGDRVPRLSGQYELCRIRVAFSVTDQIPVGGHTEITTPKYRYRGVISLLDPCGDGEVLRLFGPYAKEALQASHEKNGSIHEDRILKVSETLYSNAQTEEELLAYIEKRCFALMTSHSRMLCDRMRVQVKPDTVTPTQAAMLYLDSFLNERHPNAKPKSRAIIQNAIMLYYTQLASKPMIQFTQREVAAFVRERKISDNAGNQLYLFWAYCIEKRHCMGENPFRSIPRGKPSAEGLIQSIKVRQYLTPVERDWLFRLLMEHVDACACAFALGLWCGLPQGVAMALTWNRVFFRSKSEGVLSLMDTDLGEAFCCATHNLSFALTEQASEILWTQWKKLREQGKFSPQQRIVGESITAAKLANYVDSVFSRLKAAGVAEAELPLSGGYPTLVNTYRMMIDNECDIADDEGTRRFLQHRPLSDLVTDDYYVAYTGEEAWARQRTILRRIAPRRRIRQTVKTLDNGTIQYAPQRSSNRLQLNMSITLQPGESVELRAAHGFEGTLSFDVAEPKESEEKPEEIS